MENGDIDPNEPPKNVWESQPAFMQPVRVAEFRAAFNKLKSELGVNVGTKKGDSIEDEYGSSVGGGAGGYGGGLGGYANDEAVTNNNHDWMPIHTVFEWCDSLLRERLTVIVVMPSGINPKYTLAVVGGGTKLEVIVEWPSMMVDPEKLHKPFKTIMEMKKGCGGVDASVQDYITKIQEFKLHINGLGRKMDRFESKATIDLPKTVHAHLIETNAIGRNDEGSRILYINLLCECTDSNK